MSEDYALDLLTDLEPLIYTGTYSAGWRWADKSNPRALIESALRAAEARGLRRAAEHLESVHGPAWSLTSFAQELRALAAETERGGEEDGDGA